MSLDLPALSDAVARHGPLIRVLVTRTAGSAPRTAGTSMLIWEDGTQGTIGGGALEYHAIACARARLAAARAGGDGVASVAAVSGAPVFGAVAAASAFAPAARSEPDGADSPAAGAAAAGIGTAPAADPAQQATPDTGRSGAPLPPPLRETHALGPSLGQCCGGSVSLVYEAFTRSSLPRALPYARPLSPAAATLSPEAAARAGRLRPGAPPLELGGWLVEAAPGAAPPLVIWGAGHVGRAIAAVIAPLPDFAVTLIDTAPELLPHPLPPGVEALTDPQPERLVSALPTGAHHLVLTHSHPLDLALCHALLTHGFASLGLIGSASKWARFRSRLSALGHGPAQIARIACPIGDPSLGSHPQAIAISVAASLISPGAAAARAPAQTGDT